MSLLKWLFGKRKTKVDGKTTEAFQKFEEYYTEENKRKGAWESHENYLIRYILITRLSPFDGDDDCKEVRKFFEEQGINKNLL